MKLKTIVTIISFIGTSFIGTVAGYGSPPPPPPPPCNTPQCQSGTFCYSNTNQCTPCPSGYKYITNPNVGVSSTELWGCSICPEGTYTDTVNSAECIPCQIGSYTSTKGSTKCDSCLSNEFSNIEGNIKCTVCSDCPLGKYILNECNIKENTKCESCNIIENCETTPICSNSLNSKCSKCISEYYLSSSNLCASCNKCIKNLEYETKTCTLTSDRECLKCRNECPSGMMLSGICSGINNPICIPCSDGFYKSLTDDSNCLPCINDCNVGFELDKKCSKTTNSICNPCQDGFYKSIIDDSKCLPCSSVCDLGFELNHPCFPDKNPECVPCQDGFYKSHADGSNCLPCSSICDPGFELNHPCFSDKNPVCVPCQDGFYKSLSDGSKCLPCISMCNPGFELNHPCFPDKNPDCVPCQDGFYKSLSDGSKCLPCNDDCGEGSYISEICNLKSNSKCSFCPVNTANPNRYSLFISSCIPCKDGSTSVIGSATCIQCPLGTATFGGIECSKCAPGTYTDNLGSIECKKCSAGTYSNVIASSTINNCFTCDNGFYSFAGNEICIPCPIGTYEDGKHIFCKPCLSGEYNNLIGQITCKKCPAGTENINIKSTNIDSCIKCSPGFYSHEGHSTCLQCSPGTYTDKYGTENCNINLPGTYTSEPGSINPIKCFPGSYSDIHGATKCKLCKPGYMNTKYGLSNLNDCIPCSVGTFINFSGSTFCYDTPKGTYQDKEGQTTSILCPIGTSNNNINSNNKSFCKLCSLGKYQPNNGSHTCIECSMGFYQNLLGQPKCIPCPMGTYNEQLGADSINNCIPCEKGTYSSILSAITSETCLISPIGTYVSVPGSPNYTHCEPGYYQNNLKQSSCIPCPAGKYNPDYKSTNVSSCVISPIGNYVSKEGSIIYIPCELGNYSNITGAINCKLCNPGNFTDKIGSINCQECPSGKYTLYNGANNCNNIGLPFISVHNITQTSYNVRVNTNFTSIIPMSYICSNECNIYINNKLLIEHKNNEIKSNTLLLKIRLGIDTISVTYNKFFNSSINIKWTCSKLNLNTYCYGIPDNIVILLATMETKKNIINTYANPDILFSSTISKYSSSQSYNFHLTNLEPSVKYSFKLVFKIVNESSPMEPIIIKDIITKSGIPTEPVQNLVKYFIGITPDEHILNEQSKLKIHWEPPRIIHQHGPIIRYNVSYTRLERKYITYGPNPKIVITPSIVNTFFTNLTTILLNNLNPDTDYIINVYPLTTAIGEGPVNIINLKTSVSAPPKPPPLNLVLNKDDDIIVSWSSLTNETGKITKIWIISEPYSINEQTPMVVHIPQNSTGISTLPFPHEGIKGFFGSYNIFNTCESHIFGFTFISINSDEICGGFCDNICDYGTSMLDPTIVFPTNDKKLKNDNYQMLFNNTNGVLSTRLVPYLTMKKRLNINNINNELQSSGKFLLGDGLLNIKSKLNNTLLDKTLNYRLRFIVFTSETLYSISDPLDISHTETSTVSLTSTLYIAFLISGLLILLCIFCSFCYKKYKKNNIKKINENDNFEMKNINDQIFIKKMNIPKDITTESVSNPLYWNSINNTSNTSKENDYYLNEPTYFDVSTKPIVPPNSSYFDTSESNPELPEKKSTYLECV